MNRYLLSHGIPRH
ncbi:hypothetical protein DVL52_16575 [Salmonella enterica]|uniref:Uncharacterized protein n=1 Tax=Salmonella enterica subsp. enterica serovar Weltevreden TaxID=57743 RepID=A0A5V8MYF3_SALET|nr:hypothetical protein [Salmonella enterica subsp. enterica serovar Weltevreden]EAA6604930.1 hypothetical protein [Salmonella enterica subsp. enterica]EBK8545082.1 hypothetical protein [Salmonella enterica]EAB6980333.1 hypothetical protein [Salmonella enterica subsp. enterica serovar Weltevreden]EAB7030834.1 hypothetical protein [Salmonella enterica subsp. enterica serovar Weltevreden]